MMEVLPIEQEQRYKSRQVGWGRVTLFVKCYEDGDHHGSADEVVYLVETFKRRG